MPPPARCVCAKARHALWQVHVVQHPNVASGVDAHTLFDEALLNPSRRPPCMVPGLRWLCSLMLTSGSRSAFRAGVSWAPTTQIGIPAEELLVREHHARQVQGAPRRSCLIFVLMLFNDQSGRDARISRGFRPSTSHCRSWATSCTAQSTPRSMVHGRDHKHNSKTV